MKTAMEMVREFHEIFNIPQGKTPHLPNEQRRELRKELLKEEWNEYLTAEAEDDMVEIADALADMVYIICGTAIEYGIPLTEVFTEVHYSNLTKLVDGLPVHAPNGKIVKGPDFEPPRIATILQHDMT